MADSARFDFNPVEPALEPVQGGALIQRTMGLLATSVPDKHNRVKILVYGQSVSAQEWWLGVKRDLQARFPDADLQMENRSIGGFSSQWLIHTCEHDLYPFYPDLVIFRVLGDHYRYEDIIARLRCRTTAEVLIWNESPRKSSASDAEKGDWNTFFNQEHVPAVCDAYRCEFANTGNDCRAYLNHYGLSYLEFVKSEKDQHLNDNGNWLLSELIKRRLVHRPGLENPDAAGMVRELIVGEDVAWQGDSLELAFEGNRVDVIAADGADGNTCEVLIDGKKPSEFPELYVYTRCSGAIGTGWPVVMNIRNEAPLIPETWTLRITEANDDLSAFTFDVTGSKTGPDGGGSNNEHFVSDSGRVVIATDQWSLKRDYDLRKVKMPIPYEATWTVDCLFCDTYREPDTVDATREHAAMLAQGLANTRHVLTLKADGAQPPAIRAIRVYRPAFTDESRRVATGD